MKCKEQENGEEEEENYWKLMISKMLLLISIFHSMPRCLHCTITYMYVQSEKHLP
jgi:hypothetical protein